DVPRDGQPSRSRGEGPSHDDGLDGAAGDGKCPVRKEKEALSVGAATMNLNSSHVLANFGFEGCELSLDFIVHVSPQIRSNGRSWGQSGKTLQVLLSSHGLIRSNGCHSHGVLPFAFGSTTASSNTCVDS